MEDLITFDIWGCVRSDKRDEARAILAETRPNTSRLSILQATAKRSTSRQGLLLVENVGWAAAEGWLVKLADIFDNVEIYQSGYGPVSSATLQYCPIHDFHFAGILGCPVCGGRQA